MNIRDARGRQGGGQGRQLSGKARRARLREGPPPIGIFDKLGPLATLDTLVLVTALRHVWGSISLEECNG